jgi:hypothetical protein
MLKRDIDQVKVFLEDVRATYGSDVSEQVKQMIGDRDSFLPSVVLQEALLIKKPQLMQAMSGALSMKFKV